jgi:streptogramin lyase
VADGRNICIITDIAQGPGGILYITSNDPTVMRFNVATQSFETPVQMPNINALGGNLAGNAWFTQETRGNAAGITNAGGITEGKVVKGSGPFGITVAPNGDPWYTMMAANKIATLQLR